jgi:hypothetical protein
LSDRNACVEAHEGLQTLIKEVSEDQRRSENQRKRKWKKLLSLSLTAKFRPGRIQSAKRGHEKVVEWLSLCSGNFKKKKKKNGLHLRGRRMERERGRRDRQRDRQTNRDRQTDRQTGRQTETDRTENRDLVHAILRPASLGILSMHFARSRTHSSSIVTTYKEKEE